MGKPTQVPDDEVATGKPVRPQPSPSGGGGGGWKPAMSMAAIAGPRAGTGQQPDLPGYFGNPYPGYQGSFNPPAGVDPGASGVRGSGAYGLPVAFDKWNPAARYSFIPALNYEKNVSPIRDYYKGELGKDYEGLLAEKGRQAADVQFSEGRRKSRDSAVRGGFSGGAMSSAMTSAQLDTEAQARAGAYGIAAQQATLYAQQMKNEAARNWQNVEANVMNALLVPAQMQAASSAKVPVSGGGPTTWGQAAPIIGAGLGALAS